MIYRLYFLQSVKGNWFLQVKREKKKAYIQKILYIFKTTNKKSPITMAKKQTK